MSESIHGHEVMRLIGDTDTDSDWTYTDLIKAIGEKFGEDARFHTCFGRDMNAAALVEFLRQRRKQVNPDGRTLSDGKKLCGHEQRIQDHLDNR